MSSKYIFKIFDQHAEESAFLWILRDAAVHAPHYDLKDLIALEERIEAHLDGLRIAGDAGWQRCEEALQHEEAGEVFVATVLAIESAKPERVKRVVEVAGVNEDTLRGFASALGWLPRERIGAWAVGLLKAKHPLNRRIGLIACSLHRHDPGPVLGQIVEDDDYLVQARALRLSGELRRRDLTALVRAQLHNTDDRTRFEAARAACLLRLDDGPGALLTFVRPDSPWLEPALQLALRAPGHDQAVAWIRRFAPQATLVRTVIQGTGIIGDPAGIPWLIGKMQIPELARLAGEAFTLITGADLAELDLEGEQPEGFEPGPTENPEDDDVALDADEDLPWPDPDKVAAWWTSNQARFQKGRRYLLGQPTTIEHCLEVLRSGYQRQRAAAALELALLQSKEPLFEVRAPGRRQRRMLTERA